VLVLVLVLAVAMVLMGMSSAVASVRARNRDWPMASRVLRGRGSHGHRSRVVRDSALSPRAHASIVGGSQIDVTQVPWQVFVLSVIPLGKEEGLLLLCSGSIIDETHVVTAGHCMFNPETGSRVPAEDVLVVAGTSDFAQYEAEEQDMEVTSIRVHPRYEHALGAGAPDDIAVLQLAKSLTFNTFAQPIEMVADNTMLAEDTTVNLTGFGRETSTGVSEGPLHSLGMTIGFSNRCGGEADAVFLCASSSDGSGCNGDSGSGLTYGSTPTLVGVMDTVEIISGEACRDGAVNGFVNVAAPEIRDFIEGNEDPPIAPRGGGISIRAVPRVGYTATCESGSWSGSPSFTYIFMSSADDEVLQSGPSPTYEFTKADAGLSVSCEVLASNAGGTGAVRTYGLPVITTVEESNNVSGPGVPYTPPALPWSHESGNESAAQEVKEAEAERAAKERKSREESETIERAQREVEARGDQPAKAAAQRCTVPSVKGDSLDKARRALSKAHCKLGKVTMPDGSSGAVLVVTHQRTAPGKKLPAGTRVGVTVDRKR
jgi:Trypsin